MDAQHDSIAKAPSPIKIERDGNIATLTLNRPEQRNPLSLELLDHIFGTFDDFERDKTLRVLILTGAGPVFCAGAQLGTVLCPDGVDGEEQLQFLRGFNRIAQRLRELDLPVIAAVNGPAVGGGAALALACDLAIAAPAASYHFAFGRVGAGGCDMGCAYFLPRIVGTIRAKHWLLTGATVGAKEGLEAGLFIEVCPPERLLVRAKELALRIAESGPRVATSATKLAVARGEEADFQTCISYEAYIQSFLFTLDDHKERVRKLMDRTSKGAGKPS